MKPRDPRRWLDQSGSETEMERALLDVGRKMDPPPNAKDAVWSAMVGLGGLGGVGGAIGAGGAGGAGGAASGGAAAGGGAVGTGAVGAGAVGAGVTTGAAGAAATATTVKASFGAAALLKVTTAIGVLGVTAVVASGPSPQSAPSTTSHAPTHSTIDSPSEPRPARATAQPRETGERAESEAAESETVPRETALRETAPRETTPRETDDGRGGAPSTPVVALTPIPHVPARAFSPASTPAKREILPGAPPSIPSPSTPDLTIPLPPAVSTLPGSALPSASLPAKTGTNPNAAATPTPPSPPTPPTAVEPTPEARDDIADRLSDEAALVSAARRDLRQGNARAARARLEQGDAMFAGGTLEQERKVLYVEALVKTGSVQRAKYEAAMFLRAHPASPHAARLRALIAATASAQ